MSHFCSLIALDLMLDAVTNSMLVSISAQIAEAVFVCAGWVVLSLMALKLSHVKFKDT